MATTRSASMERSTTMAGHSRVNSSTMLSSLRVRLSSVVSNWKSSAHRAFGAMGHMAPTRSADAPEGLLALAIGHPQALVTPEALDALVVDPPALPAGLLGGPAPTPPGPLRSRRHAGTPAVPPRRRMAPVTARRWVERCWPTTATRSTFGDPEPLLQHLALLHGDGSGSEVSLSQLLEHRLVELGLGQQLLQPGVLAPRAPSAAWRRSPSCPRTGPASGARSTRRSARCRHTSSSSAPPARSLLPSASLRMIWSGVCLRRLVMVRSSSLQSGASDPHNALDHYRGITSVLCRLRHDRRTGSHRQWPLLQSPGLRPGPPGGRRGPHEDPTLPTSDLRQSIERYNRTLLAEWACARTWTSEGQRARALAPWLHIYNHHRHHTAIGGPPISRVNNLVGQNN